MEWMLYSHSYTIFVFFCNHISSVSKCRHAHVGVAICFGQTKIRDPTKVTESSTRSNKKK